MRHLSFIAILAVSLLMMVGCSEKYEVDNLPGLQLSSSYIGLPQTGGSNTITVHAAQAWQVDTTGTQTGDMPWLNFSTLSGEAGTSELTISAEGVTASRSAVIRVKSGDETQIVNIQQGEATVTTATVAEVIAGPEGASYRVTGTVTSINNTSYGNFYLDDGTGSLYIYGTKDASGNYNWKSFDIEVGDEVTVQGPKKLYNGTVELVDAEWISTNKSLIKVDSITVGGVVSSVIPSSGGDVSVHLTLKGGDGIHATIPEDAQDWLSIKSLDGNTVVFHATENTGAPRTVKLAFTTQLNGKDYTSQTTISQAGAGGTLEVPFTAEEAITYVNGIGGDTPSEVYVKGIVSKIANNGEYSAQYGNGTFYISTDGEYHDDKTKDLEVFRGLWLGNQKWAEGNAQISVGSEVIIHGTLTVYNGTPETKSGKAYVYSINGVTTDANGIGTASHPFNAVGGVNAAQAGVSGNVYVSGIVSKIANRGEFGAQYGNGSFYISTDGTYHDDKALDFEAYQVNWLGNRKWVEGDPQIAVGDKVTIFGPLTLYNGTAETKGKSAAYIYQLNGKAE